MITETRPHVVDGVWYDPESIREFSQRLAYGLREIDLATPFNQIVMTSRVGPGVGLAPLAGNISVELQKPLVFWKETSGFLRVKPHIKGNVEKGAKVVVVDSKVYEGDCFAVIESLVGQGYLPVAYVALIDVEKKAVGDVARAAVSFNMQISVYSEPLKI